MNIKEAFTILKAAYGTDFDCARQVDLAPNYFEALRNGRSPLCKRTAALIILKAQEVEACRRKREEVSA